MNNGTAYNEELDKTIRTDVLDTMSEVQDYALELSTPIEPIRQVQVEMTNTMSICPYCSSNIDADADFDYNMDEDIDNIDFEEDVVYEEIDYNDEDFYM